MPSRKDAKNTRPRCLIGPILITRIPPSYASLRLCVSPLSFFISDESGFKKQV